MYHKRYNIFVYAMIHFLYVISFFFLFLFVKNRSYKNGKVPRDIKMYTQLDKTYLFYSILKSSVPLWHINNSKCCQCYIYCTNFCFVTYTLRRPFTRIQRVYASAKRFSPLPQPYFPLVRFTLQFRHTRIIF